MITEMQERVTRAILPAFEHISDKEYRKTIAGCWARAAIEAMREPTDEIKYCEGYPGENNWRAIIDAALTSSTASPAQSQP
jgi:hypothetical protein